MRVLTAHFKALSQRDMRALADTMNFPFGSVEGTTPVKVDTAQDFIAHAPASLNMSLNPGHFTDHDGYLGREATIFSTVSKCFSMIP